MKKYISLLIIVSFILLGCAQRKNYEMVYIKGGTFTMGSPRDETGRELDEVQHQVTVSSFLIGKYEVTQSEYQKIMKQNQSNFKGENLPIETISWYNAILFCNKLSQKQGLSPAYELDGSNVKWFRGANGYRLPTEAEWEYACRAGTSTPFNTGINITTDEANYDGTYPYGDNAQGKLVNKTMPVGSFPANDWGIHDMHGNVYEWCWDWYGNYIRDEKEDPTGPTTGSYRIVRGGSWVNGAETIRSSDRGIYISRDGNERIGIRLARNAP